MNNIRIIFFFILLIIQVSCAQNTKPVNSTPTYIGEAKILEDGTIVVHSFIQSFKGEETRAHIIKKYKKDDPNYEIVKKHIGDIKVGETKLVLPFKNNANE